MPTGKVQGQSEGLPRISIARTAYVSLRGWATAQKFVVNRPASNTLELAGRGHSMSFIADQKRCWINGVCVWLSHPVTEAKGVLHISVLDLASTLQPLLSPAVMAGTSRLKTICIDPGHGGKDPGNCDENNQEKKYTLLLARELGKLLTKAGFKVIMTRNSDQAVSRDDRAKIANRNHADLFISLHFNGTEGEARGGAQGVEVYCLTPSRASSTNSGGVGVTDTAYPGNTHDARNILLAYELQRTLVNGLQAEDRGVRRARFEVLRDVRMPAVLIEGGFMSNRREAERIYRSAYRLRMAQSIVEAVENYRAKSEANGSRVDAR